MNNIFLVNKKLFYKLIIIFFLNINFKPYCFGILDQSSARCYDIKNISIVSAITIYIFTETFNALSGNELFIKKGYRSLKDFFKRNKHKDDDKKQD